MKKKILLVHHSGSIGGAGVSLFHIAKSLMSMSDKYEIEVYCPIIPPDLYEFLTRNQIKTIKANNSPLIFNHYSGGDKFIFSLFSINNIINIMFKKSWKQLKNVIKQVNPDIVVVNSMTLSWMGYLLNKMDIKTVCFHRETYADGMFGVRTSYLKRCLKKYFDAVVFISKSDLIETGDVCGITRVITDKVDFDEYEVMNIKKTNYFKNNTKKPFSILYLGGISKLKGAHIIIKAMSMLKNENVRLIFLQFNVEKHIKKFNEIRNHKQRLKYILGVDYESNILELIDKHSLWDDIDFYPTVTNPERFIYEADIVVFPSCKPHQSRPIYEAGVAKKPIIITNFRQTSEFAIEGFNCLTFENENYKDLAQKILLLKNNSELYENIAENNYQLALKNHKLSDLSYELDDLLSKL